MRVAPYSYDWIDNFGRQSPRKLTPGLDDLAIGQEVMTMFELVAFESDHHLTIRSKKEMDTSKLFGDVAVSYVIFQRGDMTCRLLVKLLVRYPEGLIGSMMRLVLPPGDLVMMRKQLLNFKKLSERADLHPG